ncbi:MAG: molecular chaperone HtpG [Bryobacterales bacterium]|nr:molecular chaperone HtpG [Bryobacterales bacterium]
MATATEETRNFEAETRQLLDLMIHSLYTNKEIFLRELISNASDALDKLRFRSLTDPDLLKEGEDLEIRLEADADARTLTVQDNGIGMSRQEVIDNIGSIARSGTQEMLKSLAAQKESKETPELIGRFGVGFYSAFMVAEQVVLETRKAGEESSTLWRSEADGTYTLSAGDRRGQGTTVTLHLKPADPEAGMEDFASEWTLESVVKRYSNFIAYPIRQRVRREKEETDEKGIVKPDGKTTYVVDDKTLNSMKPIWTRPESEVTEEEYNEFYKHISGDWRDALLHIRFKAEGVSEYESVLFVPSEAPPDLFVWGADYGLQLYARRVMIMERCDAVLPNFLRFVRGVVDSSDIPLNISRQTLQENRHLGRISKFLAKKVLETLGKLQRDDEEKYLEFWGKFGRALKEGVDFDAEHKKRLMPLLMFESSNDPQKLTTLQDYVSRMKEGQDDIYYITGESRSIVANSPLIEAFMKKDYEVLFLTDPVDEFLVARLTEFEGKTLRSAGKGDLDLGSESAADDAKSKRKGQEQRFRDLFGLLGKHLEEHVKQVRLSSRLTTSPACLTVDENDMSPHMERMLRMAGPNMPKQKRVLEVNGGHELVKGLQERFEADKSDPALGDFAEVLYGYAMLAEGAEIEDPAPFKKALESIMMRAM